MLSVTFTVEDSGEVIVLDATGFETVMHLARDNDVPFIEGECGGEMTCGTCHVYVESLPERYMAEHGPIELDMLEVVMHPTEASRLACQLHVDEKIDGLRLRVPAT